MRTSIVALVFTFSLIPIIDLVLFITIRRYVRKKEFVWLYWIQSLFFLALLIVLTIIMKQISEPKGYIIVGFLVGILTLFYIPKLVYIIFGIVALCFKQFKAILQSIQMIGVLISLLCFLFIGYTLTIGRYQYNIHREEVYFSSLPRSLNNFTIVQLSDLHLGSHTKSYRGIKKLVRLVNEQNADIVVFTGDMVNNFAIELTPWMDDLSKITAKYGKYAVMGNHDYGDYSKWESRKAYEDNINLFKQQMKKAGFILLNNDYVKIPVNKDTLYLAGVENWGKPPFKQYGRLDLSLRERGNYFTILLSHDPTHWEAEIIEQKVPLTLSGHTHAMQMGISKGGYKWSPGQYLYSQYDGLYCIDSLYLNVNRGQGYLGYPGRIGIPPQVDVIRLMNNNY